MAHISAILRYNLIGVRLSYKTLIIQLFKHGKVCKVSIWANIYE